MMLYIFKSDVGMYVCVVFNMVGERESGVVEFVVLGRYMEFWSYGSV